MIAHVARGIALTLLLASAAVAQPRVEKNVVFGMYLVYTNVGSEQFGLAPFQSVVDMEGIGNKTRVVLKARFSSEEDKRKHVEEFRVIEGAQQLLQRLKEQAMVGGD